MSELTVKALWRQKVMLSRSLIQRNANETEILSAQIMELEDAIINTRAATAQDFQVKLLWLVTLTGDPDFGGLVQSLVKSMLSDWRAQYPVDSDL